jgi:hypothetical protein
MSLVLGRPAPPWRISGWLNVTGEPSIASLRGRAVLVHAFQMLCPGCVQHALPQLLRVQGLFDPAELAVIGLHTVFEHHAAVGRLALEAFVQEYRLGFPIGIDEPAVDGPLPTTMRAWGLRGTPTLGLLDRGGVVRLHQFGAVPDLRLGAVIASALQRTALVAGRSAPREGIGIWEVQGLSIQPD